MARMFYLSIKISGKGIKARKDIVAKGSVSTRYQRKES